MMQSEVLTLVLGWLGNFDVAVRCENLQRNESHNFQRVKR
jgi:hypothetical protein